MPKVKIIEAFKKTRKLCEEGFEATSHEKASQKSTLPQVKLNLEKTSQSQIIAQQRILPANRIGEFHIRGGEKKF
jgi:hypothetical protein